MNTKSNSYPILLIILLIGRSAISAQEIVPVGITFGTTTYMVTSVEKYDDQMSSSEELVFFQKHFSTESYSEYRSFYYNDACIASEDEFRSWHNNLNGKIISPEAIYCMYTPTDTFTVIAYSIASSSIKQFFPLCLQRKNRRWYLLDLRKSEETMNMKMYMAFVEPAFLQAFLAEPEKFKNQYITTLFTAGENLNGDLMMNYYQDRYDPSSMHYAISKTTFHDVAVINPEVVEKMVTGIQQLANEYQIPAEKQAILERTTREGNYSLALAKIAEWSNTFDVVEITGKFYSGMKSNQNDH